MARGAPGLGICSPATGRTLNTLMNFLMAQDPSARGGSDSRTAPGRAPSPAWRRWVAALLIVLSGLAVLHWHRVLPLCLYDRHLPVPLRVAIDSEAYLAMASGDVAKVDSPFTKRQLYPWVVRGTAAALRLELPAAFLVVNVLALALLAWCLALILETTTGSPFWALLLLLTPLPLESLELAYLADLFHMSLSALFFLLLLKNRTRWSLAVLLVCFLARESTMVLCFFCAVVAAWRRDRLLLWGSLGVLGAGWAATSLFARMGQPNIHHLPDALYMALKVPYNFLANVCGVVIWSDVRSDVGQPLVTWTLPAFLHLGKDKAVGLCLNWSLPANTLIMLLTLFGTAPLFAVRFLRPGPAWREAPAAIQAAFLCGVVSYLLGTSLGWWTERLIGYGWPACWIALPWLIRRAGWNLRARDHWVLCSCFLLACWWPPLVSYTRDTRFLPALGALAPWALTAVWLRALARRSGATPA